MTRHEGSSMRWLRRQKETKEQRRFTVRVEFDVRAEDQEAAQERLYEALRGAGFEVERDGMRAEEEQH
jgi:hypothetical protein